ncbi:arylamine N-acetyltransferase family protein [Bernardetia sp.]|uniref:arylamine N-acetyltransferase family protein n=1 Tax=Bernardetia sp. TaxID=1937974 RepID=UPI0025BF5EE0|nr:arylamine N-acetyltransferase [Bernardetia sp.]
MNTEKYLQRINYKHPITIDLKTLNALQEAHLNAVPFENLDIHYKRDIKLHLNSIFDKVVIKNRGGFCYELNGLFFQLLTLLGFDAKMISARVYKGSGNANSLDSYGNEYDHLAIIVKLKNEDFLVDVGFGKFSLHTLPIKIDELHKDQTGNFIFDTLNADYLRVNEIVSDKPVPQYIFTKQERILEEFEDMCLFHQTSSESHFTKKKVISMFKKTGRITLTDNQLKITKDRITSDININVNNKRFEELLLEWFSIRL